MKSLFFTLAVFLVIYQAYSQKKDSCYAGVYITQADFIHKVLSHKINKSAEGYKLDFSFPADLKLTLKIMMPDTTFTFKPGTIYGYTDCGNIFRYFAGGKELDA